MAPRGEITLTVTFGPAATPVFGTPVAYAGTHAETLEQVGPKTYRASFAMGTDPDAYGRAMDLVHMVYGWRATYVKRGLLLHRAIQERCQGPLDPPPSLVRAFSSRLTPGVQWFRAW